MVEHTFDEMNTLYEAIAAELGAKRVSFGGKPQAITICPICRAEDDDMRASFGYIFPRGRGDGWGFKCFACNHRALSLVEFAIAANVGHLVDEILPSEYSNKPVAYTASKKKANVRIDETKARMLSAWTYRLGGIVESGHAHKDVYDAWYAHKRVPREVVDQWMLGVGPLPSSKCNHDRLLVPVVDRFGKPVWIRGRKLNCSCKEKWLAAGGVSPTMGDSPPWHPGWQRHIEPESGKLRHLLGELYKPMVYIVENMVDALLISHYTWHTGMAIMSVTYRSDRWLEHIKWLAKNNHHLRFVVALDAHGPGNGWVSREHMIEELSPICVKDFNRTPEGKSQPAKVDQVVIHNVRQAGGSYIVTYSLGFTETHTVRYTKPNGPPIMEDLNSLGIAVSPMPWKGEHKNMDVGSLFLARWVEEGTKPVPGGCFPNLK